MKFAKGTTVMTRGIKAAMQYNFKFFCEIIDSLERYSNCDWGELCAEDKAANDDALKNGHRLLGKYDTSNGPIYIITEWDRSVTTVLFPDEY